MTLESKSIIVTGAAGGIGRSLVAAFARGGARLVLHDRDAAAVEALAKQHGAKAGHGDIGAEGTVEALVALAGEVDIFVSNAGVMFDGGLELPLERWSEAFSVNVLAHVRAARAVVPRMLERGGGHLVNVCSAAGMLTAPGAASYASTKHAALGFSEWLAIAYGDRGISVHAVCPEAVDTRMFTDSVASGNEGVRRVAARSLVIDPAAVAQAVVDSLEDGRFLVTTHPDTLKNTQRKWSDPERWLKGMRSFLKG